MIGRLYEPLAGEITFDGQEITKLNLASVRDQITIVSQDIVIFDQSIEDNIRYADPSATEGMVLEAAKSAEIIDLISKAVEPLAKWQPTIRRTKATHCSCKGFSTCTDFITR